MIQRQRQFATSLVVVLGMALSSVTPSHCHAESPCVSADCCQSCCEELVNPERSCCSTPSNSIDGCCCEIKSPSAATLQTSSFGRELARPTTAFSLATTLIDLRHPKGLVSELDLASPSRCLQAILCCWQT